MSITIRPSDTTASHVEIIYRQVHPIAEMRSAKNHPGLTSAIVGRSVRELRKGLKSALAQYLADLD